MSLKITVDQINDYFDLVDEFDYSGESYPSGATQMGIKFKIIAPSGNTSYINSSTTDYDIYPDSDTQFTGAGLPVDGAGAVQQGAYQIQMTRDYVDGDGDFIANKDVVVYDFTLNFTTPTGHLTIAVDYFTPVITSTDATTYLVNGVLPAHDRTHEIIFPQVLDPVPTAVSGTGPVVSTNSVYSDTGGLTYTFSLDNDVTYEFTGATYGAAETLGGVVTRISLYVTANVSKKTTTLVENPAYICQVYCALKKLMERYELEKCDNNQSNLRKIQEQILVASAYMTLMRSAYECGQVSDAILYKNKILDVTGASEDCDCCCNGDGPELVQGLGGQGGHTIVEGVEGQTVVTFDGSDTYTVGLADAVMDAIAGLDISITSPNNTIAVSSSVVNGETVWTIDIADGYGPDQLDVEMSIAFANGSLPTLSILRQSLKGTTFQEVSQSGDIFMNLPSGVTNYAQWLAAQWVYELDHFINGGGTADYFPETEITIMERTVDNYPEYAVNWPVRAKIANHNNEKAILRIIGESGNAITGNYTVFNSMTTGRMVVKITFTA